MLVRRVVQRVMNEHRRRFPQRKVELPAGRDAESLIIVPKEALYYACLGCVEIGKDEASDVARYAGRDKLQWWVETGQHEEKAKSGARGLVAGADDLATFTAGYERTEVSINGEPRHYVLRVTQVYRREDGEWKVAHRHADTVPESEEASSAVRAAPVRRDRLARPYELLRIPLLRRRVNKASGKAGASQ